MKIFSGSKGIMRILEVVIASIVLLAALSYFISPQITQSDWQTANIQTETQDALAALDKAGLLDKYVAERDGGGYDLYNKLSAMLPVQTDFSMNVVLINGSSYDLCCSFGQSCCKDIRNVKSYTKISYISTNYTVSVLVWRVFY